MTVTTFWIQS